MEYPGAALYIGGRWIDSTDRGTISVVNPADESEIARIPIAGAREISAAVDAARRAQAGWSRMLPLERFNIITAATKLLRDRIGDLSKVLSIEQGKPVAEAEREVGLSADIIDFLAEEAKRLQSRGIPPRAKGILSQTVVRVPVGPVAAFTPWNFPANLPARKIGGALAAGCTMVLKPSEATPATAVQIVRAFADAGLPGGVLNVLFGEPAEISQALIENPDIAKISFTGSVAVGRHLGELAARHLKRYTAELGGHAPVIVGPDVDPESVAKLCVAAKYRNAGQICTAPIRFLVHHTLLTAFRDVFVAGAESLKVGPGTHADTQMGPLVSERRVKDILSFVDDACSRGGRLLCGGRRIGVRGYFVGPTVIEHAPPTVRAQHEEPFGPLALLDSYKDVDDAITRANGVRYGLAAYAFTHDLNLAHRFQTELNAGMVGINHFGVSQPETPFGGIKDSGIGHESGLEGLLAYTDVKFVSVASL